MGKKRSRSGYTSKGQRDNIARDDVKAVRRETGNLTKEYNKIKAWCKGKNPWITIPGPGKSQPYIRVKAVTLWGDPRKVRGIYTREDAA